MQSISVWQFLRTIVALFILHLGLTGALSAQTGRIEGKVTDAASGATLEGARILVVGTPLIQTSNQAGEYSFRSINPGTYEVRVLRIGYQQTKQSVTVGASETVALNFTLKPSPVQLDEIVTTATGEQRKLEVANAVSTIDAATVVQTQPITEIGDILSGRAAGVQVTKSGGMTGAGTRIRIRGSNSLSLSNDPLVYIDGVRMESNSSSLSLDIGGGIGGGATSALNDLNPEDIEDIEIVKGPAAATLYGIQASNGVIRITTKRGSAGKPKWNFYTEQGSVADRNTYPLNYFGRSDDPDYDGFCIVPFILDGSCVQSSITRHSALRDKDTKPFKAGYRQEYGASVSGGSDVLNYYIAANYENQDGVFRLPRIEEDSVRAARGTVPESQIRPNALEKVSLRLNVGAALSKDADISANVGYTTSDVRLVENDNSFLTITGSAEAGGSLPDYKSGWYFTPAELWAAVNSQQTDRFIGSLSTNYRPTSWLSLRGSLGYDDASRNDGQFFPTDAVADYLDNRKGVLRQNQIKVAQTSVDLGATARTRLSQSIGSKTAIGGQFFRTATTGSFLLASGLAVGSQSATNAAKTEATNSSIDERSVGLFIEEEISLKSRLFLTAALRVDNHSAFGSDLQSTVYPKASVSWLVSDEPFWGVSWLSTFRLRGAFGVSGRQPGPVDALRYFTQIQGVQDTVGTVGATLATLGNPDLKPERTREIELGADGQLFNGRVAIEATYYNKRTTDGLVAIPTDPSTGIDSSRFVNAAITRERGFELAIDTRIIDRPGFLWDLTLTGSTSSNKLISLGGFNTPITLGFYQRHVIGYPLGGFWSRELESYEDANGDGMIGPDEYVLSDSLKFVGSAQPTRNLSLNTGVTLFKGQWRLGAQFDYRGGFKVDNSIENFRCTPILVCRGLVDPTAPLREQARAEAAYNSGANAYGFFEDGSFLKLRELSLTWNAPEKIAGAVGGSKLSVTVAGRNLWTITDYTGVDPEVNAFGQSNFATSDFESQPQVTTFITRVSLSF